MRSRLLLSLVTLLSLSLATVSTNWERPLSLRDAWQASSLSIPCTTATSKIHVPNWMKEKKEVVVGNEEEEEGEEFEEEELSETWKEFVSWKTFKEDFQRQGKVGKAKGRNEKKEEKEREDRKEGEEEVVMMKNKVKSSGKENDDMKGGHYKIPIKKRKAFEEVKEKGKDVGGNVELIFQHYEDYLQDFAAEEEEEEEVDKEMEMEGEKNISSNSSHSLTHFIPKFLPPILSEQDLKEIRSPLCRSKERYLPPDLFHLDTCALCYHHLVNKDVFASKWRIKKVARKAPLGRKDNETMGGGGGRGGSLERKQTRLEESFTFLLHVLVDPDNENVTLEAQISSSALLESFKGEEGRDKWKKCCKEAVSCCTWMLSASWPAGFCPNTWDTWQCWPASSPGIVAQRPCPSYVYFDKKPACTKKATKSCEMDGKWMRRLLSGGVVGPEWSNYSTCSVHENIHRRLHVHIAAYTVSVFALLPALCIFFCYKQLRVPRITLHKHLFLSLLLNAAGVIAQRLLQLHYSQWIEKSPLWCVALTLINRYTSLTCYMWYFCEGLYLHTLLVSAFTEQRSLLMFYLIGWGLPAVVMVVYGGLRSLLQLGNERCWMLPADGGLNWLINLPPLLAILANIVFLFNIIRILVSKVRAGRGSEPSQYRKAVRATLMVVPLFGLQYVVTMYRIQEMGCDWPHVYQLANNIIEGSTGWLVAVIFCYTNGEVRTLMGRSWERYRERRASLVPSRQTPRSRSFSTAQTSLLEPAPNSRQPLGTSGSGVRAVFTRRASRGERVSVSLNVPPPGRPPTPPPLTEASSNAEREEGAVLPLLPPAF